MKMPFDFRGKTLRNKKRNPDYDELDRMNSYWEDIEDDSYGEEYRREDEDTTSATENYEQEEEVYEETYAEEDQSPEYYEETSVEEDQSPEYYEETSVEEDQSPEYYEETSVEEDQSPEYYEAGDEQYKEPEYVEEAVAYYAGEQYAEEYSEEDTEAYAEDYNEEYYEEYAEGEYAEGEYAEEEYAEEYQEEYYEEESDYEAKKGIIPLARIMDNLIIFGGVAVVLIALILGGSYLLKSRGGEEDTLQQVGSQLDGIDMIGQQGLSALSQAQKDLLALSQQPEETPVPEVTEAPEYDEDDYEIDVNVRLSLTSIEKDLKIKFLNQDTGKLVGNVPFAVEVTDASGNTLFWSDDDMDGIIYKKQLAAGEYSVKVQEFEDEKYKTYGIPSRTVTTEVKSKIKYEKVDVVAEIKSESQVDVSKEDTMKNETLTKEYLSDTVVWVESTVTEESYEEVLKTAIPNPLTIASLGQFIRLAAEATQVPEVPATETPITEVPATETPVTEVPATETPVTEMPATETPVTEVPATETPATETPATEVPATEAPATEVPATEAPVPTVIPSASPTASTAPSASPTASAAPSASPTASTAPSASPTASTAPSASPTASTAPSASPTASTAPSASPTASAAPSASPTASAAPSASPTASTAPSASPTASTAPSASPTASTTPEPSASPEPTETPAPMEIVLSKKTAEIYTNEPYTLEVKVKNAAKDMVLKAASSNTDIAKVEVKDGNVTITGLMIGEVTVTVSCEAKGMETKSAVCTVVVKLNPKDDKTSVLKDNQGRELYVYDGTEYKAAYYADYFTYSKFYVRKDAKYTGWQTIDGKVKYFDAAGKYIVGSHVIQGVKYQFASDGSLVTGTGAMGIDVSKWNGTIDWNAVKNSGVSYVIIRCGYRGSSKGALIEDSKFKENIKGATQAGLKVGVYFFSQAIDKSEALEEASMVLECIKGYTISYPIFLDVEPSGGRADSLDKATRTEICKTFCETIKQYGYTPGIYANKTWLESKLDMSVLNNYKVWLAQYASEPTYQGRYDMWQYKDTGKVNGVKGDVDLNMSYLGY